MLIPDKASYGHKYILPLIAFQCFVWHKPICFIYIYSKYTVLNIVSGLTVRVFSATVFYMWYSIASQEWLDVETRVFVGTTVIGVSACQTCFFPNYFVILTLICVVSVCSISREHLLHLCYNLFMACLSHLSCMSYRDFATHYFTQISLDEKQVQWLESDRENAFTKQTRDPP